MSSAQAEKYKEQGNAEFKKGNHAKAIEYYTYATEIEPRNHLLFSNRATAYYTMQKYDKSLRDSERAIALNSSWWKGHYKKIECLTQLGRHEEAASAAVACARQFPDQPGFKTLETQARSAMRGSMPPAEYAKVQGNEHFKAGRMEEAMKAYSSAIALCDNNSPEGKVMASTIYCNRAAVNRQLYMHDEVISDCSIAIRLDPSNVKAFIRRAQSYEAVEKYATALEDFEAASRMGGGEVAQTGAMRVRRAIANFKS